MRLCILFVLTLALVAPVFASDGILEINQTCAVQMGCFSGDTPGFPVTIDGTAGRSYLLTGDLILNSPVTAIEVLASNTSIDLNGFGIACPTLSACTGGAGGSTGINAEASFEGVTIKNGNVTDMMFGAGVRLLGRGSKVHNVRARGFFQDEGIRLGPDCSISDSDGGGGTAGISVGHKCAIRRSRADKTNGVGLSGGNDVIVEDSFFIGNEGGVMLGDYASIINVNVSFSAVSEGLMLGDNSTVKGSRIFNNGAGGIIMKSGVVTNSVVSSNLGIGILVTSGSATIVSNSIQSNGGLGIVGGGDSGYVTNVINLNNGGNVNPQVSGAIEMGSNICGGDTTCP